MKNNKLIALILSTSVLFAGCGANNQNQDVNPNENKVAEEAAVESPDDTELDDDQDDKDDKDDKDDQPAMEDNGKPKEEDSAINTTPEVGLSMNDAIDAFREHFGSDSIGIVSVDLDDDNGFYSYDIEGQEASKEFQAEIDANTGEVLESETDEDDDGDEAILDLDAVIDPDAAMEAALKGQDGAYVTDWKLETDDGMVKYEIDIENGSDKKVDALTSEVYDD